jgi:D-alanyl-D-alanine carboxypeptidase
LNGIEGATSRMAEIQSRFVAMQTQQAAVISAPKGATSTSATAFATKLADAVKSGDATSTTAAGVAKSYKLNGKGIPTELAAYGNGKIPSSALESVGNTNHKLWAPAAESLTTMIADAKKDGVKIGITDSYRSYSEQVDVARRKGLYSQGGLAAKPGTSEHGWGMATDLDLNSKALSWMRDNGARYGFHETVKRESWHWSYRVKT